MDIDQILEAALDTFEDKLKDLRDEAVASITDPLKKIKVSQNSRKALAAWNSGDKETARAHINQIKQLMASGKLTGEQAVEAVNAGLITSDESFDFFEYGTKIS